MAKKILSLPSITRFIANAVAIVDIPIGPTYFAINFNLTGTGLTAAMIGSIKLFIDDKPAQTYNSLTDLIARNAYHGLSTDTVNNFMLWFKDDDFIDPSTKRVLVLGTANIQTARIEIQCLGTLPADALIKAVSYIDTIPQPLGPFLRIENSPQSSASAGVWEYSNMLKNGVQYKAIHIFKADANKVTLTVNNMPVIDEVLKTTLERFQKSVKPFARVPQTAVATHVDFVMEGTHDDFLNTTGVNDLRLKLDLGTPGSFNLLVERIDVYIPGL